MMLEPAHFVADAGALCLFGTLLFRGAISKAAPRRLVAVALAIALLGAVAWLAAQASAFGAPAWDVAAGTLFGRVLVAQAGLFVLAALLPDRPGAAVAGLGVMIGTGHGHGAAMEDGGWLAASHALHLLSAGAWLGGLPALVMAVVRGDAACVPRFSRLAVLSVAVLGATALYQGWILGGGLPGLIGTAYGAVLGAKLVLFLVMLGFGAWHRFRLTPNLPASRRRLAVGVTVETGLGLLAVGAAVLLGQFTPGIHDQPWWPFALRPDGAVLSDPDLRGEVIRAGLWCLGALVLLGVGLRWRWAWIGVPVALWFGVPSLSLLLVPAHPTSYWTEPAAPSAASVARGAALFPVHCAVCHGAEGKGDGPAAKGLPVPPADLTAEHLWEHRDGELFWWLTSGIPTDDGGVAMPGFGSELSEDDRWALIDFIRARNPHKPAPGAPRMPMMMMHHHM